MNAVRKDLLGRCGKEMTGVGVRPGLGPAGERRCVVRADGLPGSESSMVSDLGE